jgi:hypothetical protein
MPDCEACGGPIAYGKCRECGAVSSHAAPSVQPDPPRYCPLDGAQLRANGFCPTGDGFPLPLAHPPDTCPHCRAFLRWDGDCLHCVPPGEKPGHRYDYDPYKPGVPTSAHWRIAERGPQPIAPPTAEQKAAISAAFNRLAPPAS